MAPETHSPCRTTGCPSDVPMLLRIEALCPVHFIEHALFSATGALDCLSRSLPVEQRRVDWLLSDAAFIARELTEQAESLPSPQRDHLLELLLCLANLNEYVRHHSVSLTVAN